MERPLKVGLVVNAAIGPGIASGPGREGYEVAQSLIEKDLLGKVFCLSVADDCDLPARTVAACGWWAPRRRA